MGRCDRKHSAAAKAAVVAAMEEQGLTADAIVTLAAAGQLKAPNGYNLIPPFEIAASTVRNYVQFARRRERRASTNGGHDADDGAVPNHEVTVAEKPQPAKPKHPYRWSDDDLEDSEFLKALLLPLEHERGDTTPLPPPD